MGLLAAALTPWAIRVLFGAGFSAAVGATYFLIGATSFWGMGQVLEQGLRAVGHPRVGIVSNLAGLVAIFALGIPGCLRFGINGLAAASLAAQFLNLSILVGFCIAGLKMSAKSLWAFDASALKEIAAVAKSAIERMIGTSDGAA
jgi:O-antigen/teichoic acid export membrane protein